MEKRRNVLLEDISANLKLLLDLEEKRAEHAGARTLPLRRLLTTPAGNPNREVPTNRGVLPPRPSLPRAAKERVFCFVAFAFPFGKGSNRRHDVRESARPGCSVGRGASCRLFSFQSQPTGGASCPFPLPKPLPSR
jgi:hypothetical protein